MALVVTCLARIYLALNNKEVAWRMLVKMTQASNKLLKRWVYFLNELTMIGQESSDEVDWCRLRQEGRC